MKLTFWNFPINILNYRVIFFVFKANVVDRDEIHVNKSIRVGGKNIRGYFSGTLDFG